MAGLIATERCAQPHELTRFETPWETSKGVPIVVTVHKSLIGRFRLACHRAARYSGAGRADQIDRIDSFNCRSIRGSSTISNHGRGAAFDFFTTDPGVPPPGGVWTPDNTFGENFARCFTDLGFTWGRQWDRRDDPHLEWRAGIVHELTDEDRERTLRLARNRFRGNK